jgi:hypothetical protein
VGRAFWGLLAVAIALGAFAPVAHASLSVPTGGAATTFSGTGASTSTSLAAFEAAIGGRDNGTSAGEQGGGFRHLNWDGLAVNGSDPSSRTIEPGKVVGLSAGRLEPWGIEQGPGIAVANDGFASANPTVTGDFTPFSTPNVWAPYNSNTVQFQVVAPGAAGSVPVPAQTRGLGVVFLNVTATGTTIQYYNGDIPLLSQPQPVSTGSTSFAGALFPNAVVTRVVITLGTAQIFNFDGGSITQPPPTTDFVAGDDVGLAEPAPVRGAASATAGVPVTAPLDAFIESSPNATVTAVIDWGDGAHTAGTITPGSGGTFVVTGNHAYAKSGTYTAEVTVDDFSGPEQTKLTDIVVGSRATTTSVTCSPSPVTVSAGTVCTAAVGDLAGPGVIAPSGLVTFSTTTPGAAFGQAGGCMLAPTATAGVSVCSVRFIPGQMPPNQARVAAAYGGDDAHAGSGGGATVGVRAQRCSLQALTRRLRSSGLGILVTCDAQSGVEVGVKAQVARSAKFRPFSLTYGTLRSSVTAGRPTVLVVKPANGVLKALRDALRHHQRVSLRVTLTASARSTQRTTTTRVSALRIS